MVNRHVLFAMFFGACLLSVDANAENRTACVDNMLRESLSRAFGRASSFQTRDSVEALEEALVSAALTRMSGGRPGKSGAPTKGISCPVDLERLFDVNESDYIRNHLMILDRLRGDLKRITGEMKFSPEDGDRTCVALMENVMSERLSKVQRQELAETSEALGGRLHALGFIQVLAQHLMTSEHYGWDLGDRVLTSDQKEAITEVLLGNNFFDDFDEFYSLVTRTEGSRPAGENDFIVVMSPLWYESMHRAFSFRDSDALFLTEVLAEALQKNGQQSACQVDYHEQSQNFKGLGAAVKEYARSGLGLERFQFLDPLTARNTHGQLFEGSGPRVNDFVGPDCESGKGVLVYRVFESIPLTISFTEKYSDMHTESVEPELISAQIAESDSPQFLGGGDRYIWHNPFDEHRTVADGYTNLGTLLRDNWLVFKRSLRVTGLKRANVQSCDIVMTPYGQIEQNVRYQEGSWIWRD